VPPRPEPPKAEPGRIALALGCLLYAALVVLASLRAGPRGWGLHAPGFLPSPLRVLLLAGLVACAGRVAFTAFLPPSKPPRPGRAIPFLPYALMLPYACLLWVLRARTQLLGDGTVWLDTARQGDHRPYNEPLFAAAWHGFAALVRLTNRAPAALSMSLFSVICGVLSVPILAGIAGELAPGKGRLLLTFTLLLSLGISQLYFGYIESYPFASLFILLYLWLLLRRARGADVPWWTAIALALAIASHLSALSLVPSYLLLLLLEKGSWRERVLALATPFVLLFGLLAALDYRPEQWAAPIRAATSGMRQGFEGAIYHRLYGFFSYPHAADVMNAILLAMPVPALLILAWAVSTRGSFRPLSRPLLLVAVAALPGLCLLAGLMTPVSPAQDWDLASIFLLPAAVFGVGVGARLATDLPRRGSVALAGIGILSLLSFVLVNQSEEAAVRRFAAVVNDPGRVSRYGRSYGNSVLELYERDRGNYAGALHYARETVHAEPTNPRNWTNVGYELMQLVRIQEAVFPLEEAVRRGPDRWEGRYNLGLCYNTLGRYAEAVPMLREAARLKTDSPVILHDLGFAYYKSGHPDSSAMIYSEIVRRWPGYVSRLKAPTSQATE